MAAQDPDHHEDGEDDVADGRVTEILEALGELRGERVLVFDSRQDISKGRGT